MGNGDGAAPPTPADGGERTDRAWSQRWLAHLDTHGPWLARRRQRGAALSRRGRVTDISVVAGQVRGRVQDDRVAPYEATIDVDVPSPSAWDAATDRLAAELRHTAELLDGRLPVDVDDALDGTGVRLLPGPDAPDVGCTCPDDEALCIHVVALHHAFASLVERDPFVLLRLRGRTRARLLDDLRARRLGADSQLSAEDLGINAESELFVARGDLDAVALHPAPVDDPARLLQRLGPPPGVTDTLELERLLERAAATAWRLASGEGADVADDEELLTELRAQGTATAASVSGVLGRDVDQVRGSLDRLFEAGVVLRTGSGDDTRYRAAAT